MTSRPDAVSAMVAARAQGLQVEDESARTEATTSWANPDGTITTDAHAGAVRFRDGSGVWQPIDLSLAAQPDGTVTVTSSPSGLTLAGARKSATHGVPSTSGTDLVVSEETPAIDRAAAKRSGSDRQVVWGMPGKLGAPTISGSTATYQDVSPGVDLRMDSRRSGFEQSYVIRDKAAVDALVAKAVKGGVKGGVVSFDLPVKTRGLTARMNAVGDAVEFVAAQGVVSSRFELPVAFDAATNPQTGEPVSTSTMKLSVTQTGKGKAVVSIAPDLAWLTSADRVFPVTIDPTYASGAALYPTFDAFVQQGTTTSQAAASELKLGNNGSGQVARSFISFNAAALSGKVIESATLSLYETWSWSCAARLWEVYGVTSLPNGSTVWTNQPGMTTNRFAASSVTKGASSACAAGWVTQDVRGFVQQVAGQSTTTMALRASDESDAYAWKRFASSETAQDPVVTYTYNRVPNVPAYSRMGAVASYTPPGGTAALYTPSTKPSFWAKGTDADGNTVAYVVQVLSGSTVVSTCTTGFVASGAEAGCAVGTALADNTTYTVRFAASDNMQQSAVSGSTTFRTAFAAPPAPTISCPAPYADGSWTDALPAASVTCTVTATGNGTTAAGYLLTSVDGAPETVTTIVQPTSSAPRSVTVVVSRSTGGHKVTARTQSPSGVVSTTTPTYGFGYGSTGLTSPVTSPRTTTTGVIKFRATGPPHGSSATPTASVKWRVAGSGGDESTGWNTSTNAPLTVTDLGGAGVIVGGTWNTAAETTDAFVDSDPVAAGVQPTTLNPRVPVLLEVQVCLAYPGSGTQCTWSQQPVTVQRVPHAFGNGFPEAAAGPGKVALWTGEFATAATDASVPGYNGDLSVGRSHATYAGVPSAVNNVFGPGWTANFDGPAAGAAGLAVYDSTRADGTIALVDGDGSALVYQAPVSAGVARRTTAALTAGVYPPANEDTRLDGSKVTVTGTGAATTLAYTQDDGTITTFLVTAAPTAAADAVFAPDSVTEPAVTTAKQAKTTFVKNAAGKVTNIVTAGPGTACTVTPGSPVTTKGCRSLRIDYAATTTATTTAAGDIAGQVRRVTMDLWDPAAAGGAGAATSIVVATYKYDASTRLSSVTDPRTTLTTAYGYDSGNRVTSITPAGLQPFTFAYDTSSATAPAKLLSVSRTTPTGTGTTRLAAYAYGTALSGEPQLPTMTGTAASGGVAALLGQAKTPIYAAAVFGQDYQGPVPPPASPTAGSTAWKNADLQYTDDLGYTIDTASFGTGDWQYTATDYDDLGNTTRTLDVRAARAVLSGTAVADQAASYTLYNADISGITSTTTGGTTTSTTGVVTPKGTMVLDTLGPARFATVPDTSPGAAPGATVQRLVRPRTHTDYDQGAPTSTTATPAVEGQTTGAGINPATGMPYRLATTTMTTAVDASATVSSGSSGAVLTGDLTALDTVSLTRNGYAKGGTTSADGWALGSPVTVTTDMGTGNPGDDLVRTSVYDDEGAVVSTSQPSDAAGSAGSPGAGTRTTVNYTTAANAAVPTCGGRPEWAGLVCRVAYGAPTSGPALPSTTATYTVLLQPLTVQEYAGTSAALLRTTTTHYDTANRPDKTSITTAGAVAGSSTVASTGTVYDASTGLATATTRLDSAGAETGRDTTGYDTWGRDTSYLPAGETTPSTTTYDGYGRVATVADAKGTTTYGYDRNNPDGTPYERRGLTTSMTVTTTDTAGGTVPNLSSTGTYNADGDLTTETLPGGISRTTTFDEVGQLASTQYTGDTTSYTTTTDPTTGTVTYTPGTTQHDQPWLGWSQDNDIAGRTVHEWTPIGSAFTDGSGVDASGNPIPGDTGNALGYDRRYAYDRAGRLTQVQDRTAAVTGSVPDESTGAYPTVACQTRRYTFDHNGNRTGFSTEDAPTTGTGSTDCPTGGGTGGGAATTKTWAYDTADRLTTGAAITTAGGATNPGAPSGGSYAYDSLGRATTVPAADTPNGSTDATAGDLSVGYFDTDAVASLTQASKTTSYTLDVAGRRATQTTQPTVGPPATDVVTRHYTDTGDNPTWVDHTTGTGATAATTSTRYAETLGGDLGLEVTTSTGSGGPPPDVELPIANPHGDTVTTINLPVTGTGPSATLSNAVCIGAWSDYDEYGNPKTPANTATVAAVSGGVGYGWLGNKQRATDPTTGLILMGARLYNRTTGQFTSLDPEYGGNTTNYSYPQDPINGYDLSGHCWGWFCHQIGQRFRGFARSAIGQLTPFGSHRTAGIATCIVFCASLSYQGGAFSFSTGALGLFGQSHPKHFFRNPFKFVGAWGYTGYANRFTNARRRRSLVLAGTRRFGAYGSVGIAKRGPVWDDWEGGVTSGYGAQASVMTTRHTWKPFWGRTW